MSISRCVSCDGSCVKCNFAVFFFLCSSVPYRAALSGSAESSEHLKFSLVLISDRCIDKKQAANAWIYGI